MLTLSLSSILIWLVEGGQAFGRFSSIGLLLLVLSAVLFLLFFRQEKLAQDPLISFSVWKNPVILYANLVSLTTGIVLIGISSYLPTYVSGVMEQRAMIAGFTLTAMSIGWPLASSLAGHLLIRFGPFPVSFAGGISIVIGSMMFVFMNVSLGPIWAACSSFFIGIGMGLTNTAFIVTIQGTVPRAQRGSATAANMFMKNFGSTIGASVFGAILNGTLLTYFAAEKLTYTVDDVNGLLTEEGRSMLPLTVLVRLKSGLESSLHWVYIAIAVFAWISLLLILRIPRGKVYEHVDN